MPPEPVLCLCLFVGLLFVATTLFLDIYIYVAICLLYVDLFLLYVSRFTVAEAEADLFHKQELAPYQRTCALPKCMSAK